MPRAPEKFYNFNFNFQVFDEGTEEFLQNEITQYLVYAFETCPETGRDHIQGYIVYPNQRRPNALFNRFFQNGRSGYIKPITASEIANDDYSLKECKYGGFFERGTRPLTSAEKGIVERDRWETIRELNRSGRQDEIDYSVYIRHKRALDEDRLEHTPRVKRVEIESLRPWQETLKETLLSPPDPRKILWYYDREGGKGKTTFIEYATWELDAVQIPCGVPMRDYAVLFKQKPKIVLMNAEKNQIPVYQDLEKIKDGAVFQPKYNGQWYYFPRPHVVVFSNDKPLELLNGRITVIEI